MKKVLCLLLCLTLTAALFAGCKAEEKPNVVDGKIKTAADLKILAQDPTGSYTVDAEIDMGGAKWDPVEDFSGTLSGLWGGVFNHTISNFVIEAGSVDEAVGFFRNLTGVVSHLNFKDVTVILPADFSGKAGVVAGIAKTALTDIEVRNCRIEGGAGSETGLLVGHADQTVEDCFADGTMELNAGADGFVGGMAGSAAFINAGEARTEITLKATAGDIKLGGIAGSVGNLLKDRFGGRIDAVGEGSGKVSAASLAGEATASVLTCYNNTAAITVSGNAAAGQYVAVDDSKAEDCVTREPEITMSEAEYALRKTVVDYSFEECTIPWTPSKEMHYEDGCTSKHIQDYHVGEWYFGLPYTHFCGSLEKFSSYLNEDCTVVDQIPETKWGNMLGNDCADMVYWALERVSASPTYLLTDNMICESGMIAVGDYTVVKNEMGKNDTRKICEANGDQKIFEAYARLKMGDAIVKGPAGHTRLISENAYVYRNEDGTINGERSYVVFQEQGAVSKVEENHSTCRVGARTFFKTLFSSSYVPVTIPEYAEGKISEYEITTNLKEENLTALRRSNVTSNYRINFVKLEVTQNGKTVFTNTAFPAAGNHNVTFELSQLLPSADTDKLKSGKKYHGTVYVNDLEPCNVAIDFDFTA